MSQPQTVLMLRLRFFVRFLGLTGLLLFVAMAVLLSVAKPNLTPAELIAALQTDVPDLPRVGVWLLLSGLILAVLTILIEFLATLGRLNVGRSFASVHAGFQVVLAVVALIGINAYSWQYHRRFDVTERQQFTLAAQLPPGILKDIRQLRSETTVLVYQRHKTFGQLSDKPDAYDYAAERKVVEKVRDAAALFRELGASFRVVTLDVEEENFDRKLIELTANAPELRKAIDSAPENSIFFYANGRVQRLNFNDFYQLDKTKSREANGGAGNLVLMKQGLEGFARRVLAIESRKPVVCVASIHEYLTTQGIEDDFTLAGLRKSLEAYGFEVRDVVLKRWGNRGTSPVVYSFDESRLERVEARLAGLARFAVSLERAKQQIAEQRKVWETAKTDMDLRKKLEVALRQRFGIRELTDNFIERQLDLIRDEAEDIAKATERFTESRRKAEDEQAQLLSLERLLESRRETDLRVKLAQQLDEADLVIIPRMTIMNLFSDPARIIQNRLYALEEPHADALRDYLKSGKPLLACIGPGNEPSEGAGPPPSETPDPLVTMLAQLGVRLGKQTILYDVEVDALSEVQANPFGSNVAVEIPPLDFTTEGWKVREKLNPFTPRTPLNPIRDSMATLARSVGRALPLRVEAARPVYFMPNTTDEMKYDPEFLVTDSQSWNEEKPFVTQEYTPNYQKPRSTDPTIGTPDERRRGPFPIGVAVEVRPPGEWYDPKILAIRGATAIGMAGSDLFGMTSELIQPTDRYIPKSLERRTLRLAVIGQGGLFIGPQLTPAKERLLLTTVDWLLGREDRLPKAGDDRLWAFPRVDLSERDVTLWRWGALLGLPLLAAYFGVIILMMRKLR